MFNKTETIDINKENKIMNKKVSVVVPVYNVEQYLEKCIESIINQTYEDLEIILVDDGSTDVSPSICDKWKDLDSRIIVVHKENGGLSSARNAGLEVSSGEYIMFEDSDDWLESDIIEKCVEKIEEEESDLVIFGYRKVNEEGLILGQFTFGDGTYTNSEMASQLHQRIIEMSFGYAWNKLYRLNVIRKAGIKNDERVIDREDLYFNLCLFNHLTKISFLDYVGYYYLQRKASLLHNKDDSRINSLDSFCEKMSNIDIMNQEIKSKVINMILLHYISDCLIKNIIWNKKLKKREKLQLMNSTINKCNYLDKLYYDQDNPKYLNVLFNGIKNDNLKKFYKYVRLSGLKRIITERS